MSRRLLLRLLSLLLVVGGVTVIAVALPQHNDPRGSQTPLALPSVPVATIPTPSIIGVDPLATSSAPRPSSAPTRIEIPSIGVSSSLQALGIEPDGSLQSPSQWQVAGWFAGGVRPGDVGPAVIAGHVDSIHGPAVFYRLKAMKKGDVAYVQQADGARLKFVVDDAVMYPKTSFPTEAVYGPTSTAQLRLITCTGDFDFAAKSYLDNLVVYAHLAT